MHLYFLRHKYIIHKNKLKKFSNSALIFLFQPIFEKENASSSYFGGSKVENFWYTQYHVRTHTAADRKSLFFAHEHPPPLNNLKPKQIVHYWN